jgi:hypothetical protein
VDFAELGQQPLTAQQTIAKAYEILNKTRRLKTDITDWNRKPEIDKTWTNFKTHFRRAHQEFRETTDITLEKSDLERNNANLVQQVVEGLQTLWFQKLLLTSPLSSCYSWQTWSPHQSNSLNRSSKCNKRWPC